MRKRSKRVLAGRRRINSWKFIFRNIVILFVIGFITGSLYILSRSEIFSFTTIQVEGNQVLSQSKVKQLSGMVIGTKKSIWWDVDLQQTKNLLLQVPYIRTADAWKVFPHTVVIHVSERRPLAILATTEMKWLIDTDGRILDKARQADYLVLSWIHSTSRENLAPGIFCRDRGTISTLRYLQQMNAQLKQQVQFITSTENGVVFYTKDHIQIRVGSNENISAKLAVLLDILTEVKKSGKHIQYIDLRFAGHPVIK